MPASAQIIDWPESRTVEVVLEARPAVAGPAPLPWAPAASSQNLASVLGSLDSLAGDFENLAARFAPQARASVHVPAVSSQWPAPGSTVAMAPPLAQAQPLVQALPTAQADVYQRLEAVADDIAWLSMRLQSATASAEPAGAHTSGPTDQTTAAASAPGVESSDQAATSDPPRQSNPCSVSPAKHSKERSTKEPTPRTPGSSTRKAQAHQGGAVGHAAGRSRNGQAKADSWRNQRDSLTISINKVAQLGGEPSSPKFVKEAQVWGKSQKRNAASNAATGNKSASPSRFDNRSADAIRERIEKKLMKMFGDARPNRAALYQSI